MNVSRMETVFRDYTPRGVKFYYVYKALAHPEYMSYLNPFTLEERLMHVAEAKRTLGMKIPWIVDNMENTLKEALSKRFSNAEMIIDAQGKVIGKRAWSRPEEIREALTRWVGPVENPTRVEDLNIQTAPPPKAAASGVVPRIDRPDSAQMRPLIVKPESSEWDEPFYAKLRAEAQLDVLKNGKGQLYLGFHLDPLYNVHWNNLVRPIRVLIEAPPGVTLSSTELSGPEVEEESDIDPREFLLDIVAEQADEPIRVSTFYYACNDEEGWCKPLTQSYLVYLKMDWEGGSTHGLPQFVP